MSGVMLSVLVGGCVKGSVILIAAAAASILMKKAAPKLRHALWASAILCFPIAGIISALPVEPLLIGLSRPQWIGDGAAGIMGMAEPGAASAVYGAVEEGMAVEVVRSTSIPLIALCVWAMGTVFLILRNAAAGIRIRHMVRESAAAADPRLENAVSIPCRIMITGDGRLTQPFTFGVIRPTIVIPEAFLRLPPEDLRLVISHEAAHAGRRDVLTLRAAYAACAIFWFVPWIWAAFARLRVEQEKACDLEAAGTAPEGMRLAELLVEACRRNRLETVFSRLSPQMAGGHDLRERVENLLKGTGRRHGMKKGTVTACAAVVLVAASALGLARFASAAEKNGAALTQKSGAVLIISSDGVRVSDVPLLWPLGAAGDGSQIGNVTLTFGKGLNPITHREWTHRGIDIAAGMGTPVVATARGVVTGRGYAEDTGNFVVVSHASGFTTTYCHLRTILVAKGQALEAGQTVGELGNTGISTGPHLHYEVIYRSGNLDPLEIVGAKVEGLTAD